MFHTYEIDMITLLNTALKEYYPYRFLLEYLFEDYL